MQTTQLDAVERAVCRADSVLPSRTSGLHNNVVNDRPNASRVFCCEPSSFFHLDRLDQPPQLDSAVLNRDSEHQRPPRFCSQSGDYLLTQLRVIGAGE
jgi:hypothetical protein